MINVHGYFSDVSKRHSYLPWCDIFFFFDGLDVVVASLVPGTGSRGLSDSAAGLSGTLSNKIRVN